MEHAPLRPVPARPAGPVDPEEAVRAVASALPGLNDVALRALAAVEIVGRLRPDVAVELELTEDELGRVLAGARKELRKTVAALSGGGWCQRTERLISDRLDGVLSEHDAGLLEVHLRNCPRCVEHERRLVQATDALLAGLAPVAPSPAPAPRAPLTLVREPTVAPDLPRVEPLSMRGIAGATGWRVALILVVILTLAALALAVAGVLGAEI